MTERRHGRCPGRPFPTPNRRDFLQRAGGGFGMTALAALLAEQSAADSPRSSGPWRRGRLTSALARSP